MIEMQLSDVRVSIPQNTPVVLLKERHGPKTLFIFIGHSEAEAIARAMRGAVPQRPLTHDLFRDVLSALGVTVEKVVVSELRLDDLGNGTYFAELHLRRGEERHIVSARPSDAIALAARVGAPIFAAEEVVESEGQLLSERELEGDDDTLVERFHDFIEGVRPEDFVS